MLRTRYCDGIPRRDVLRVGLAGLSGGGLPLSRLLAGEAAKGEKDDVSVLILFLKCGLSTIDTLDLKPQAPAEFRGEFSPIDTNVPGMQIGEHLPLLSRVADRFSLVRSFGHRDSNHGPADHYMLTGYYPTAGFNPSLSPNNQKPAFGSIIAKKLGSRGEKRESASVPSYVCLPSPHPSCGAAYLGATCAPLVIEADPA